MRQVDPKLFTTAELQSVVRRMIIRGKVKNYVLTDTAGGIGLRWETALAEDRKSVRCKLAGPDWTLHAAMNQNSALLEFDEVLFVEGNQGRFETDIIYLKMDLST